MSKIVHALWLNPSQSVSLYPAVLAGMKIEDTISRPSGEFFFVATAEEAQELKARMEKHIPLRSYTILDGDDKPIITDGHPLLFTEPEITILDIP